LTSAKRSTARRHKRASGTAPRDHRWKKKSEIGRNHLADQHNAKGNLAKERKHRFKKKLGFNVLRRGNYTRGTIAARELQAESKKREGGEEEKTRKERWVSWKKKKMGIAPKACKV